MPPLDPQLCVVIDSVIRLREQQLWPYPDPNEFAAAALRNGADAIALSSHVSHTCVRDRNSGEFGDIGAQHVRLYAPLRASQLNTLTGVSASSVTLVPHSRHEHSSGGSLAVEVLGAQIAAAQDVFRGTDIRLGVRIDPEISSVAGCIEQGIAAIELNCSSWALAVRPEVCRRRLDKLLQCADMARSNGIFVAVRGGLSPENVAPLAASARIDEIRAGQSILGRALIDGVGASVARMRAAMTVEKQ